MNNPKIIVALDVDHWQACEQLARRLDPGYCRVKVGKELFTACGPAVVEFLQALGFEVFLDLKFHDIPATVGKAVKVAANLGVWMVNVHASGGVRMLEQALDGLEQARHKPLLIAVTVLTSMTDADLIGAGVDRSAGDQVDFLTGLAFESGLHGVVCSAHEAGAVKRKYGEQFLTVTPGIRLEGATRDDQRRVMTPSQAIAAGSDFLVIGRPVTTAAEPADVCVRIHESLVHGYK